MANPADKDKRRKRLRTAAAALAAAFMLPGSVPKTSESAETEAAPKGEKGDAPIIPPRIDDPTITREEVGAPPPPENPPVPTSPKRGYVLTIPIERIDELQIVGGSVIRGKKDPLRLQYPTTDKDGKKITRSIMDLAGDIELDAIEIVITQDGKEIESQFRALTNGKLATYIDETGKEVSVFSAVQTAYKRWLENISLAKKYEDRAKALRDGVSSPDDLVVADKNRINKLLADIYTVQLAIQDIDNGKILDSQGNQDVEAIITKLTQEAEALASDISAIKGVTDSDAQRILLEKKSRQSLQSYLADQNLGPYADRLANNESVNIVLATLRQDAWEKYQPSGGEYDSAAKMFYVANTIERDWFALLAQELQDQGKIDEANALWKTGRVAYVRALQKKERAIRQSMNHVTGKESIVLQRSIGDLKSGIEEVQKRIDHSNDPNYFDDRARDYHKIANEELARAHRVAEYGRPAQIGERYGQCLETVGGAAVYFPSAQRLINPAAGKSRGIGGKKDGK